MSKQKEQYNSINWSKVDASVKKEFDSIKADTKDFSDADLMGAFQENFDALMDIVKDQYPDALKKAEPKKEKPAKKEKKAKKEKPAQKKEKVTFKGKPMSEVDCDELIAEYRKRREQAKKSQKKAKTRSIFDKITADMTDAVEKAVKSIPAEEIKKDPKGVAKAMEEIQEIKDDALAEIKNILKPYVTSSDLAVSAEAKKDEEALDKLISDIRTKYSKK